MTRLQRFILAAFLLGVTSLCVWVPYTIGQGPPGRSKFVGYAPVWSSPRELPHPELAHYASELAELEFAQPDVARIGLHIVGWTALCGAAFLLGRRRQ